MDPLLAGAPRTSAAQKSGSEVLAADVSRFAVRTFSESFFVGVLSRSVLASAFFFYFVAILIVSKILAGCEAAFTVKNACSCLNRTPELG